jgi:hypothetical protein
MADFIPLQGYRLSGKIGNIVFYTRGNRTFARVRVKPHDPKTTPQIKHREKFLAAVQAWKDLSDDDKQHYRHRAECESRTGYNLFLSEYLAKN